MAVPVLIAHAEGDEKVAALLAAPIVAAGYEVVHGGTVLVGESFVERASTALSLGAPVVLCGTVRAMGTGWAFRLVSAARHRAASPRIFAVQVDEAAYLDPLALDGKVAQYWRDPVEAIADLLRALQRYYPIVSTDAGEPDKVQITNVTGSSIEVTFAGQRLRVPLEPATTPPGSAPSPARVLRARSGVIPYTARQTLLEDLLRWARSSERFATCLIGGRGGAGKTRVAVELCERATEAGWVSGLLTPSTDRGGLDALIDTPAPRLIVVDYAESRAEQLEVVLPALEAAATEQAPTRVVLLVRERARAGDDWTAALRYRSDRLDAALDQVEVHVLEDLPLTDRERRELFTATAAALVAPAEGGAPPPPAELDETLFASPLLVVIAAYLAVYGTSDSGGVRPPTTAAAMFDELLAHEHRHWRTSDQAHDLQSDDVVRQRVVALATVASASDEAHAVELLRLLPDFATVSSERCGRIARWARDLYSGPGWWNPLEPDRVGEHLVVRTFATAGDCHPRVHCGLQPGVLDGILQAEQPEHLRGPLDLFARGAPEHPELASVLSNLFDRHLPRLCQVAVEQVVGESNLDLLLSDTSIAAALERAVRVVEVDVHAVQDAIGVLPARKDLILGPLALTLAMKAVDSLRTLADTEGSDYEPRLARALDYASNRFADAGRHDEGVAASQEAVRVYRRLAARDSTFERSLAASLNDLAVRLGDAGRLEEGIEAVGEAVTVARRLAASDPSFEPTLAASVMTFSIRLGEAGRHSAALTAAEQAVEGYRRVVETNPGEFRGPMALTLNNLSIRLADVGRRQEALHASEEAVALSETLTEHEPQKYHREHAQALNTLSIRLAEAGRADEGLAALRRAVAIRRQLAADDASAFEPDLADSLNNMSVWLGEAGLVDDGLAAIEEAVVIYRRLVTVNARAYEPALASSLTNRSVRLSATGRRAEALEASEESVSLGRRLAAANPDAYDPALARSLSNLSNQLADDVRSADALTAAQEAVAIYRRLVVISADAYEPDLALALNNLSIRLGETRGRKEDALAAIQEAVTVHRRLAATSAAAYEPDLGLSLNNQSIQLAAAGRHADALAVALEAVEITRRSLTHAPLLSQAPLASALVNLSNRYGDNGDTDAALTAMIDAVALRRRLAQADVRAHGPALGAALTQLAAQMDRAGRTDEAARLRDESTQDPLRARRRRRNENLTRILDEFVGPAGSRRSRQMPAT